MKTNRELCDSIKLTEKTRFTKAFRLRLYKAMLNYLENNLNNCIFSNGFCITINWLVDRTSFTYDLYEKLRVCNSYCKLTELMAYKPSSDTAFWFPNQEAKDVMVRINILKEIIAKMKNKS